MPNCQNCGGKWSWSTTAKTSLSFKEEKLCPHCGANQYISTKSKQRGGMVAIVPMILIIVLDAVFDFNLAAAMLLAMPMLAAVFALLPFTIELTNEPEPLW